MGEFVWTGFDYLGEPTPYNSDRTNLLNFRTDTVQRAVLEKQLEEIDRTRPPSRSSYFGIIDLAGFPKDRYYNYQAHWRPELPMAHILPHWTWDERVGMNVPVHVYTSGDEAELFINGKSQGRKVKQRGVDYRLTWDDVIYEPGEVKVIAYKNGKKWATDEKQTAGKASQLAMNVDRNKIAADGYDLAFVTVTVKDDKGIMVPRSKALIKFSIEGDGEIVATDNGDPTSFVPFQSHQREAFSGLALVIVKSKKGAKGSFSVKAESAGLKTGNIKINTL